MCLGNLCAYHDKMFPLQNKAESAVNSKYANVAVAVY